MVIISILQSRHCLFKLYHNPRFFLLFTNDTTSIFVGGAWKQTTTQTQPDHQKTIGIRLGGPCLQQRSSNGVSAWGNLDRMKILEAGGDVAGVQFPWGGGFSGTKKSNISRRLFQRFCFFHPYSGRWSNLTKFFQRGWNHQLAYKLPPLLQMVYLYGDFGKKPLGH